MRPPGRAGVIPALLLALCAIGWGAPEAAPEWSLGPLANRATTAAGESRLRVLGPLLEFSTDAEGRQFMAFRPFYSQMEDPAADASLQEALWPVFHRDRQGAESFWWFLSALGTNRDVNDPGSQRRLWVLPFLFNGRDVYGDAYGAVFPLGGRIHDFLGRDTIEFVLWPLWTRSAVNYVETTDVLFPVFSRTSGKGIERFRIFPFYGESRKEDAFEKRFILWPVWNEARYDYEGASGHGFILFPVFGRIDLENQASWMVVPPLIRRQTAERQNLLNAPWPFVQAASGEVEKLYLWPFWGSKTMHGTWTRFALWPIFWRQHLDRGDAVTKRFLALPFLHLEKTVARAEPGREAPPAVRSVHRKLWPLFSYRAEGDSSRFRMLDLWPLKETPAIERNYAPLWTLYRCEQVGEAREHDLLWGLWSASRSAEGARRQALFPVFDTWQGETEDERGWSLLKGLLGWSRDAEGAKLRLLYGLNLPLGDAP